jgi:uncharacterized MAPEG superfamily protein
MTVAMWCLLIAGWLPILCAGFAKWGARDYDNELPREWLERQEGRRKRANAAQKNSWEAFTWFGVAVLMAMVNKADQSYLDGLAVFFIAARAVYIWSYLSNRSTIRSLAWLAGLITCITIFASGV